MAGERDKAVSPQDVIRRLNEVEENLQGRIAAVEEDVDELKAAQKQDTKDILNAVNQPSANDLTSTWTLQ